MPVVIMAGGRGLRLHPLTEKAPKPMLRVGDKPLLETIIEGFSEQGFKDFILTVHYRADLIRGYFGNGEWLKVNIDYVDEDQPLGTAGALRSVTSDRPFIVTNADVVAKIDYADLLGEHQKSGKDATACLALYQHQIPFGVADVDEDGILAVREKPIESFHVLAGVYVLPPWIGERISGKCDMPELLSNLTVNPYPIRGQWFDVGRFEDLAAAHFNWSMRLAAA